MRGDHGSLSSSLSTDEAIVGTSFLSFSGFSGDSRFGLDILLSWNGFRVGKKLKKRYGQQDLLVHFGQFGKPGMKKFLEMRCYLFKG